MAEEKSGVSVRIRGREFRIRGSEDEQTLRRIAGHLEETMTRLEERTGAVDSLDVALLTALNLAREVLELREASRAGSVPPERLRSLIERVEASLPS